MCISITVNSVKYNTFNGQTMEQLLTLFYIKNGPELLL